MLNALLMATAIAVGAVLLSREVRNNRIWRATVTPLASIIGSGFLVIVPLLGHAVGGYAPIFMTGIVVLAYALGAAIRYNIQFASALLDDPGSPPSAAKRLDALSDVALSFAYVISVTFYLRLLSAFLLHGLDTDDALLGPLVTTGILGFIGLVGWTRGLSFLERLEEFSVSIKLAIIAALTVGWAAYDTSHLGGAHVIVGLPEGFDAWHVTRLLAGILIVVQGFETSRYLGPDYDRSVRSSTMRRAQLISGLIYIVFVTLTVPTLVLLGDEINETAIIELSRTVAATLPVMLVLAALMSQFSAAVADTIGAGGLFAQTVGKRFGLSARYGYGLVSGVGIVLVWTADIFEIISLASRGFAIYYAIQCGVAAMVAHARGTGIRRALRVVGFGLLALLLLVCAVVAIPAG